MKTHKNLYKELCSSENLERAYQKARKGKSKKESVQEFDTNTQENLTTLQKELQELRYKPLPLKRFIVRDPKTRVIHASAFQDRIVHHALINLLEPIFEKIFIHDSYASRKGKGTHPAIKRFDAFKRKVSKNGAAVRGGGGGDRNRVQGYCLKADIKRYFDTVDHTILLRLLAQRIQDGKVIWLTKQILDNFETPIQGRGMPLGNFTSQFLANVYLNELDYFVKHTLKAKYYIRYVDDFVILHRSRKRLLYFKKEIAQFLTSLKLELHPDKSDIIPLQKGITFLGYRIFYHYKLLRKRNIRYFMKNFEEKLELAEQGFIRKESLADELKGWFGYAQWANTYNLRRKIMESIKDKKIDINK
ncbi:MAG: reverse transcriptase domain-containing protein [Nanoarchaeota archaeon]|nr:reverse transcriptase domain-containing protein [Nanoarchaeota archaeon]